MRLVESHTDVPVPAVLEDTIFFPDIGILAMSRVPRVTLKECRDTLSEQKKERICLEIWEIVDKLRTIPKPTELAHLFQCSADGTASCTDPLLGRDGDAESSDLHTLFLEFDDDSLKEVVIRNFHSLGQEVSTRPDGQVFVPYQPLASNIAVHIRIYQRYLRCAGRRHAMDLPSLLPHSDQSVFNHSDLAPRNIMVDDEARITGIVDWEAAGWYPDYWEYMNVWKPSVDSDWQRWMDRTAPRKWERKGIDAARRVLI